LRGDDAALGRHGGFADLLGVAEEVIHGDCRFSDLERTSRLRRTSCYAISYDANPPKPAHLIRFSL
jgi:hypothetical protein